MKVIKKYGVIILLILFTTAVFAGSIKPESIVTFKKGAFACVTKDDFDEALNRASKGEKTKFFAMFENFTCMPLPASEKFKILSVADARFFGAYVEITNAKNMSPSAASAWTAADSINGW